MVSQLDILLKRNNHGKTIFFYISCLYYPNPFNRTTLISFYLDKKSTISLKITNQFGQEVFNELSNTISEQGNHSVEFDGSGLSMVYTIAF